MNDFDDLDDLERELGPSLRVALRRVAAQITDGPESRSTGGEMLMNYLKAPTEGGTERGTACDTGGGGRRRTLIVVAALLTAAAVVAAAALMISRRHEGTPIEQPTGTTVTTDDRSPAISPRTPYFLDLATGERTPLAASIIDQAEFSYVASPDGTRLAFNTCCTGEDVATISNVDGSDEREVEPAAGRNDYAGRWSPDGTKIVYQERDGAGLELGDLVVQDLATGSRTQVTDLGPSRNEYWFLSPRFSADGQSVIYHLPRNRPATAWDAWSVPVTGGESTLLLEDALFPIALPGGEEIAFVTPTTELEGDTISIASTDRSGARRVVANAIVGIFVPTMSPDGTRIAYVDVGAVYVVDVNTGESSKVAPLGSTVEWLDDDTLIVNP